MQSIDSIEIYAHGTSRDLVCKDEDIEDNNIIKQYQKCLTLTILQKKT